MTDLTDAQLIARLRRVQTSDRKAAADRIEQQAEQIAELIKQKQADRVRGAEAVLTEQLRTDKAEQEAAALRAVIEEAIAAHKAGPGGFDKAHVGALAVYNILAKALPVKDTL